MASISSAGGGSSMGNAKGGLSAGDWVRLKRINASKGFGLTTGNATTPNGNATSAIYPLNKDISPEGPRQQPYGQSLLIPYEGAGTLKTLRPASNWTDYIASQAGDFITSGQSNVNGSGITQVLNKICDSSSDVSVIQNKPALPISNQFNRLKILS